MQMESIEIECTPMTRLVLVCRSVHDLMMLESLPRHVPGLSIIVYHTNPEEVENLHTSASAALGHRENVSTQHLTNDRFEGNGHALLFPIIVHLAALVGFWFGVAMTQGLISDWGRNQVVFLSKHQKKMSAMESLPNLLTYDWIQGVLMLFGVNLSSLFVALGAGVALDYFKVLSAPSSQSGYKNRTLRSITSPELEVSDSDTEENPMLRRHSMMDSDTLRLVNSLMADNSGQSTISDNMSFGDTYVRADSAFRPEDSTEVMIDDEAAPEFSIREGRPNLRNVMDECIVLFGSRQRPLYQGSRSLLPLHVCASGHSSLVADTKNACKLMKKQLYAEICQKVIFMETSFDMSAI